MMCQRATEGPDDITFPPKGVLLFLDRTELVRLFGRLTFTLPFICFTYFYHNFFKNIYFPNTFFPQLYSMVTQLYLHVYILVSHIIMLHHKWLHKVPSATQQDLIANPSQRQ